MGRPNHRPPDQLTTVLLEIEQRLNELNLGIEAWVSTTIVDSPTGLYGKVLMVYVGYARDGNNWQLLMRPPIPAHHRIDMETVRESPDVTCEDQGAFPLLEAPRKIQIAALEVIPKLVSKIEVKTQELQKALGAAKDLAGQFKGP